jgi:hypothetical protein
MTDEPSTYVSTTRYWHRVQQNGNPLGTLPISLTLFQAPDQTSQSASSPHPLRLISAHLSTT